MENKKRKKLYIISIIVVSLAIVVSIYIIRDKNTNNNLENGDNNTEKINSDVEWVDLAEEGKKINKSEEISDIKEFEGLSLETQQFVSKDSKTEIIIQVTNKTEKDTELQPVVITLLDKEGKEISKLNGIINPTKAGESTNLYISSSLDYVDAYDYKIEKSN